ncbi:HotDog domain-containing protein [Cercophora newfieldiana]|uniref:HotDog domain-containing protein n=1 Tax=Cercophora newfieldiana TaxID=92897 RepID=A0AA39YIN0_9PEZI|nr:HotDog domain-containing protein [Cercophora newfieldiana]
MAAGTQKQTPTREAVPDPEVAHFLAIPWCAAQLAATPDLVFEKCITRTPKPQYEEALMAQTLNRPDAIKAYAVFYSQPANPQDLLTEVGAFLTLGPMVNGWRGICHGGIVMTIMDECLGQLAAINRHRGVAPNAEQMTAYLNTKFLSPVRTSTDGTTVMVKARITKREGRKQFVEGHMEDANGTVLCRSEGLFIQLLAKI